MNGVTAQKKSVQFATARSVMAGAKKLFTA
jgi:hypothetical protein